MAPDRPLFFLQNPQSSPARLAVAEELVCLLNLMSQNAATSVFLA
jgi:hypothetical protein